MTIIPLTKNTEALGTMPGASAVSGFISITNAVVAMLTQLADEIRLSEPGTAELITAFTENIAGSALDQIERWPA